MIQAKQSDLVIGKEIVIKITGEKVYHKIRGRLTEKVLKRLGYWRFDEETDKEYQDYKNTIKYYVKMNYAYLESV